jgi:hypothetical protein
VLSDCLHSLFFTCFCNLILLHLFRLYRVQLLCDWFRAFSYCSSMFHLSDCVIGVSWNSVFSLASAGLAIFCCVPTTLTSGISLTQVWCGLHWLSLQSLCMYISIYYLLLLYIEMMCFVHDLQLPRQNWYWHKWEFYLWMSLTACRGQYSIGFSSNSHIKPAGNFYCKNQLPPFSIHLLQHIVGVRICLPLVCILHTLFGCNFFNPVNYHPTSHIKANSNLEDYLENQ